MSFIAELKRRNVIRAAGLYLVGAWLVAQVSSTVLPLFGAPQWLIRSVVILLAVGFVPAMIFSWIFELTPEGLKRDDEVPAEESIGPETGRRMDRAIIAILALALLYFGFDKFVLAPRREDVQIAQAVRSTAQLTAAQPSSGISHKSIAVLPFENLSADKDNAYFASGMQDMILTKLAGVGDLKVISRTSTEKYASHPDNLKVIAQQLGVATILEGSVQKSGNSVLINVQLIDANTDAHLWAQAYPRTLDNIFGVEGEVAESVAESLHSTLTRDERTALAQKPTGSPAALEAYLRGLALASRTMIPPKQAGDAFREAVMLDPGFALAWSELAWQELQLYWFDVDATPARLASAKAALDQAEVLAPDLPQVQMARAEYLYHGLYDVTGALAAIRKVQRTLPNDARVWWLSSMLNRRTGNWDQSIADLARARGLAPNDGNMQGDEVATLIALHRYSQALPRADAYLANEPDDAYLLELKLITVWNLGGLDAADRMLAPLTSEDPLVIELHAWQALYRRDFKTASDLFSRAAAGSRNAHSELMVATYVPSEIGWQLLQAYGEQRGGSSATARALYQHVQELARAGVAAKSGSRNADAGWLVLLAMASAGLGQRQQAVAEAQAAIALAPASDAYEGPIWQDNLARVHAMNGDADKALPLIEQLLKTNGSFITPALLKIDPVWDPIRKDPRFQKLIADGEAAQARTQAKP